MRWEALGRSDEKRAGGSSRARQLAQGDKARCAGSATELMQGLCRTCGAKAVIGKGRVQDLAESWTGACLHPASYLRLRKQAAPFPTTPYSRAPYTAVFLPAATFYLVTVVATHRPARRRVGCRCAMRRWPTAGRRDWVRRQRSPWTACDAIDRPSCLVPSVHSASGGETLSWGR